MQQISFFILAWSILNCAFASNSSSPFDSMTGLSDVVRSAIHVTIDPLEVIYDQVGEKAHGAYCGLSIHRDTCTSPKIRANDTIRWDTKICFKWTCSNTSSHVMRVENCWTGSPHRPIFLIDKFGCTREPSMLKTPLYEPSLLAAYSLGYLSVRLVGTDRIRLSCTVRLCHVCHSECPDVTPPRKCQDPIRLRTYLFTRWNNTEDLEQRCQPDKYRENLTKNSSDRVFTIFLPVFLALTISNVRR